MVRNLVKQVHGSKIMTRLSILFLLTFSFICYCEQREVYYSDLANKEAPPPLVVFYERASTVISCGVKCFNDNCCVRFIYNTIGKQCMGFHVVESDVYFYQQAPSWSSEMQQFRKGCASDWVEFKGHCYFHGQQTVKWSDAKFECQDMCSYLVEIEDKEEADWLAMTFLYNDNCPTQLYRGCTAWTGLNDLDTEGQYVWDHSNTSVFFTNWHRIEPSLYNPPDAHTRDCVDMYRTGEWNDRPCSYENPFICEKINF